MRCIKCKKMVPSSATICPYCGGEVSDRVEVEQVVTVTEPSEETNGKLDLTSMLTNPKYKNLVLVGGGILGFFIFIIVIMALMGPSKPRAISGAKLYSAIITDLEEFLEDTYFSDSYTGSGTYDLYIKYNKAENAFNGKYGYDLKNKVFNITSSIKSLEEDKGTIVVDVKKFDSEFDFNKGELFYKSDQLFDNTILFKFDDPDGYLSNTRYDLGSIVESYGDALLEAIGEMKFGSDTETVSFLGNNETFQRVYFELDNPGKRLFYTTFYDALADDSTFTSEMAKMQGKKSDEMEKIYRNYSTTADFKYSGDGDSNTLVSLYIKSGQIKRLEIDNQDDKKLRKIYRIDVDDSRYHFYYIENDKLIREASLLILTSEINDVTNRKYEITLDSTSYNINIELEVKLDNKVKVESKNNLTGTNYVDLTDDQISDIKTKLGNYIKNTQLVDNLKDIFIDKCKNATDCVCKEKETLCSCLYKSEVVKCPNPDAKEGNEDTVNEDEVNKTTTTTTTTEVNEEDTTTTTSLEEGTTTTTTVPFEIITN